MKDKKEEWKKILSAYVQDEKQLEIIVHLIQSDITLAFMDGKAEGIQIAREIYNPK